MGKVKVSEFDVSEYLETKQDIAGYLSAVIAENDTALLLAAIGDIAKAKGMTRLAKETGMSRTSLYKSLSINGNPEFATIMTVMKSLGVKLNVVPDRK